MSRRVLFGLLFVLSVLLVKASAQTETAQEETVVVQEPAEAVEEQAGAVEEESGEVKEQSRKDARVISGMSILGNQEAPKSLVIVPWKSSEIGNSMDISTILDDSRQPVDREVFMRALRYYEIRSGAKP